ncbi:hypothetical protein [Bdellovibrio reynosensis]|uniref:DUF5683 domain-containing protein n=1 Tax=Bdellovibrio reynosensis TaxID=2835041 RepID=A0ABY4C8W9_9BACT|nr:hypothetical protein [Bdellovibrio reynosensis]UOF01432.1 hypothetical protein MNR06_00505 [Bdellovibrio reynosensis]
MRILLTLLLFIGIPFSASAEESFPANWTEFKDYVEQEEAEHSRKGLAYMISGSLAALGGSVGYQESEEILSRTIFAITSNLGLTAIGIGATYYFTGTEANAFYYSIEQSSLSLKQKNEVLMRYLKYQKEEKERQRWIRVATHSLVAVANFYSGSREDNAQIRSMFYFLGAANTLLALSYSF